MATAPASAGAGWPTRAPAGMRRDARRSACRTTPIPWTLFSLSRRLPAMSEVRGQVQTRAVGGDEAGLRLDRWFQRHFPQLSHGALQKLLRTGQVRIDGRRAEGKDRVEPGQTIRLPPGVTASPPPKPREIPTVSDHDAAEIRRLVIHRDDHVIVLNKPPGLAVQGGTGTERHVDGMLDALRFGFEERPRLVHRLDKDTSGVLLI